MSEQIINVADYGMMADGEDCTEAFQRALDAAAKASVNQTVTIVVPKGTYTVESRKLNYTIHPNMEDSED